MAQVDSENIPVKKLKLLESELLKRKKLYKI